MSIIKTCLAGVALAVATFFAPTAHAEAPAPSAKVHYGDLDLTVEADARDLLRRLERASVRVCLAPGLERDLQVRRMMRECRAQAVARAVEGVGAPLVTALHQGEPLRQLASR